MPQIQRFRTLPLTALIGTNTVIPASAGKPISVWKILISSAGTLVFQDNAGTPNVFTGAVAGPIYMPYDGSPHIYVNPGSALVLVSSLAANGIIYYTLGD